MLPALLVLAGIVLLAVAGVGVSRPRFQPQWIGFACLAAGFGWAALTVLTR